MKNRWEWREKGYMKCDTKTFTRNNNTGLYNELRHKRLQHVTVTQVFMSQVHLTGCTLPHLPSLLFHTQQDRRKGKTSLLLFEPSEIWEEKTNVSFLFLLLLHFSVFLFSFPLTLLSTFFPVSPDVPFSLHPAALCLSCRKLTFREGEGERVRGNHLTLLVTLLNLNPTTQHNTA